MGERDLSLEIDGPCLGGNDGGDDDSGNAGTLHLIDGRHIAVRRLIHVGKIFLFFSRADDRRTQVICSDEIRFWESTDCQKQGSKP